MLKNCVGRRRNTAGLRQQDLAERAGVSRQNLSMLEAGRSVPSAALALSLARVLQCKVEDLFWVDDPSTPVDAEVADIGREGAITKRRRGSGSKRAASGRAATAADRGARVAVGSVGGKWVAHRLNPASELGFLTSADGILAGRAGRLADTARVLLLRDEGSARQTLLCAGCAPAFGILTARASQSAARDHVVWLERTSSAALDLLARGQVHVAGAHLYDEETGEFNVPFVQRRLPDRPTLIFNLARWEVGLVTRPENPKRIRGMRDLARPDVAFAGREPGAAAQDLVERLLRRENLRPSILEGRGLTAGGHWEVARLVALGAADVGLTLAAVARAHGLHFIALAEERFDLVVAKEMAEDARIARLLQTLGSRTFRREMESLGGHLARDAGKLIAETTTMERR